MVDTCGADQVANDIFSSVTTDANFDLPTVDVNDPIFDIPETTGNPLYVAVTHVTNADLTTVSINGTGTFDILMQSLNLHLKDQFEKGRITGAEYTKAYIELTNGAMAQAVQFLLARDSAYWQAITAQMTARMVETQTITARAELATAKVKLVGTQYDAVTSKATYSYTKMKLATESINYCISKFDLENIKPIEKDTATYNLANILPAQKDQLIATKAQTLAQADLVTEQKLGAIYNRTDILSSQKSLQDAQTAVANKQGSLIDEQKEVQRAQTRDTHTDGTSIEGVLGKQKTLYTQQITSYQRDSEVKAAKLFTDAWTVQKTIDEGLVAPDGFTNASVDDVLTVIKTNNGF